MRVLRTGSAGFIGTAVGRALEGEGAEVVRVDLMLPSAHGAGCRFLVRLPADSRG